MRGVALPEAPIEALHVADHTSDVREARIPAKRSVSEHPEIVVDVIVCILHFCAISSLNFSFALSSFSYALPLAV